MRKSPPFLLLDAGRGLAALWVVMHHACLPFLGTGDNWRYFSSPLYAIGSRGQLGVVLFFVISGYCIMGAAYGTLASGRGAAGYALDRLRRIHPPYLAACLLALLLNFATGWAHDHHLLPLQHHRLDLPAWHLPRFWLANILLLQLEWNQPLLLFVAWTLCYEIIFYALIGLLLVLAQISARHRDRAAGLPVFHGGIGILTFFSLIWLIASPSTCPFPLDRWYQFGLGALLFLAGSAAGILSTRYARIQLGFALCFTLIFALRHDVAPDPGTLVHHYVFSQPSIRAQAATSLIFIGILWIVRPFDARLARRPALRPLLWLGTISYSTYLIHTLVMPFPDAGGRLIGFDQDWYWVTFLTEIATALVAGWLFHLAVERHFISSRQKKRAAEELSK